MPFELNLVFNDYFDIDVSMQVTSLYDGTGGTVTITSTESEAAESRDDIDKLIDDFESMILAPGFFWYVFTLSNNFNVQYEDIYDARDTIAAGRHGTPEFPIVVYDLMHCHAFWQNAQDAFLGFGRKHKRAKTRAAKRPY